ncbi:MAG: DNA repair protein RecN [Candidatus Latescibacterota bacterium]|nr:DNA repair protein RecN [Candidatus Latescibacterota bacterium]
MLTRLHIKDFALIEEAEIEFGPGLNAITGETGAGKSILIGALNSILGGPINAELVRAGTDKCSVEGFFEFAADQLAHLAALDVPLEDGQLILRREIHAGGRSRAFVSGQGQPLKKLKQIGAVLVDLHGQHEHQSLLDPALHIRFLDAYGGLDDERQWVAQHWRAYRASATRVDQLYAEREALVAADSLRTFQLEEIRQLDPQPGEEPELERELQILANAETLVQNGLELHDVLYQREGAVSEQLGQVRRQLDRLLEIDLSLGPQAAALEELIYGIEDLARNLHDYARKIDVSPGRTDQLRERLDGLRALKKKYGGTLDQVLAHAQILAAQEDRAGALDAELVTTAAERDQALAEFAAGCLALSAARQQAGESLSRALVASLSELGMTKVQFRTELTTVEDPDGPVERAGRRFAAAEQGMEQVAFHISANAGEAPRPLARIASGGEISRVMLAFKEAIAGRDLVSILVFDEIDAGISGRIAAAVGRKLQALSTSHQTIAITHLPQIASLADQHFSVRKRQVKKRTITEVVALDAKARTEEIAYLLAGETISDTARQHAREMLQ